jgi:hypothetical protein
MMAMRSQQAAIIIGAAITVLIFLSFQSYGTELSWQNPDDVETEIGRAANETLGVCILLCFPNGC